MARGAEVIPDNAVEAAALSMYEWDYGVTDWSIVSAEVKGRYLEKAQTALEAAAPYMLSERGEWRKGESGWE